MSNHTSEWSAIDALDTVLKEASEGFLLYDRDLIVVRVNATAARLLGVAEGDVVGRSCRDLFGCDACVEECALPAGLRTTSGTGAGTVHLHRPNEHHAIVLVSTHVIHDSTGQSIGAVAKLRAMEETSLPPKRYSVVAESAPMRELMKLVARIGASEATTILIEGENGTGKDLVAKVIHSRSLRAGGPFVAINCAAVPEALLESEMFGHERGAFTDAHAQKRGLFETAHRGTLFLDEIAEIPTTLQAKLLRALEDRTFRRLGGLKDIEVDVRVIAATNRNLLQAVRDGDFRTDLYFRLNVIRLEIPPLRERHEDILPLARFFIEQYNRKFRRMIEGLTKKAEDALLAHDWPGNVRELRNAIERSMILENGPQISLAGLNLSPDVEKREPAGPPQSESVTLAGTERKLIQQALQEARGNQTHAAKRLGVSRDVLRYRMKKFGLP